MNVFITLMVVMVSQLYAHVKLTKLYTLNMCCPWYINKLHINKAEKVKLIILKTNKDILCKNQSIRKFRHNFNHYISETMGSEVKVCEVIFSSLH